ncbi:MAG: ATP-binding protein [Bryobacteraceae bacterium]
MNLDERFRNLLDIAPDPILEVDAEGRIVLANKEAEKLFGWTRDELAGQPIEMLLPERFRTRHVIHRSHYSVRPKTRPMGTGLELFALRKDGTECAIDINLSPVSAANGRVMCIIRDVSERKHIEEQIQLLNQNLERRTEELATVNQQLELRNLEVERANVLKTEFLASVSHELRTPLHAIIGFSELLAEESAGGLNPKQKRFTSHIYQGAQHLLELINDILDLSKIEAGHLELRQEWFSAASAVAEVLSSIRPLANQKGIALSAGIQPELSIFADRIRLKEILFNLFSNAVKFTREGGRITVRSTVLPDHIRISVADTGIGIAAGEHESIFQTFRQVASTTKGVREGTGLGLAITKRLVEQHGGHIWVESELGAGSEFFFTIPQGAAGEEPPLEPAVVLVVEDDESSRELVVSYLESEGLKSLTAGSGDEGLRVARDSHPDVIILDLLMPGRSGWETLYKLRSSPATAGIPIIITSVIDEKKMAFSLGATDYLVKPVAKETLLDAIRRAKRLGVT